MITSKKQMINIMKNCEVKYSPVQKSFKSSAMFVIICSNKVECPKQLTNDSRRFGDDDLQFKGMV